MSHSTRILLKGGANISKLGIGTATFGGLYSDMSFEAANEVVNVSLNSGINYFDTAPHYGLGKSEIYLGKALKKFSRENFVVSSKVGRLISTHNSGTSIMRHETFDFSAKGIRQSIKESLERLELQKINMLLIHDPDNHSSQAIQEAYPVLESLREEGLVQSIGIGMNQNQVPIRFIEETDIDFILIAGRYTLLDQSAATELLPLAESKGVSIIAAGVFNSGVLANPELFPFYDYKQASKSVISRVQYLTDFFAKRGHSLQSAAIQFPLTHPAVKAIVVGCRTGQEVIANIENFNSSISKSVWEEFNSILNEETFSF